MAPVLRESISSGRLGHLVLAVRGLHRDLDLLLLAVDGCGAGEAVAHLDILVGPATAAAGRTPDRGTAADSGPGRTRVAAARSPAAARASAAAGNPAGRTAAAAPARNPAAPAAPGTPRCPEPAADHRRTAAADP